MAGIISNMGTDCIAGLGYSAQTQSNNRFHMVLQNVQCSSPVISYRERWHEYSSKRG